MIVHWSPKVNHSPFCKRSGSPSWAPASASPPSSSTSASLAPGRGTPANKGNAAASDWSLSSRGGSVGAADEEEKDGLVPVWNEDGGAAKPVDVNSGTAGSGLEGAALVGTACVG